MYHITANGEEIICTAEHPFYVVGLGFVTAKNLSVKDKLLSSDNSVIEIDSITIETLSTPETTYNFAVADYHTYYVSENGILVHNKCPNPNGRKGGEGHQGKIDDIKAHYDAFGYKFDTERMVEIEVGFKNRRFIDVVILNHDGTPMIGYQVGVSTKAGFPVARECLALIDIRNYVDFPVVFVPYK